MERLYCTVGARGPCILLDVDRVERVAGALVGVHAGDALGATVEFSGWAEIRARYPDGLREIVGGGPFDWPVGHATDDTDLTRAVLLAYLTPTTDVVRAAADHMVAWYTGDWPGRTRGQAPRDVGNATRAGLAAYQRSGDPTRAGAGAGAAGNGSLMRCIPTALAVRDPERRRAESRAISAITHDDPRCVDACAAYNDIVAALVDGRSPESAVAEGRSATESAEVAAAIDQGATLRPAELARTGSYSGGSGFVLDSLALAVAAALDPRPFPDVVSDIVCVGRDTDTNAAIAGGLLGARDGIGAIPARWVAVLQFGAEFQSAAAQLTKPRRN